MAIKYGRGSLTTDIVLHALKSRDLELKKGKGKENEALMVRRRIDKSEKKNQRNSRRGRIKSQSKVKKCFYCHKGTSDATAMN